MERGFIQGKMEIKFLLLYILARTEAPVDLEVVTDMALCDEGVTYFDFSTALAELVETGHVSEEHGLYAITEKGRKNGATMEDSLPYSVRIRCDLRLEEVNAQLRRARRIQADLYPNEAQGWTVDLTFCGEEEQPVFHMTLQVPYEEDGAALANRFRKDPESFIQGLYQL